MRTCRFLIPLVAVAGETGLTDDGHVVDKTQELSIITVAGPDGRAVLPVFSSVDTMRHWRPDARPVPADAVRVALAAAATGTVSGGEIAWILLQSVVGGLLVGVAAGLALAWLIRRDPDQTVVNAFVLIAPIPVYFLAETVDGSGILAVVATALIVANTMLTHRRFEGRRSSVAIWRLQGAGAVLRI